MDIRLHEGVLQLLVKWKGFDDEDPGWESFETMKDDVPALVSDFLSDIITSGVPRQRKLAATLN